MRAKYEDMSERNESGSEGVRGTAEDVVREADRGRSERAPFITLSGVIVVIAAVFAVVVAIAFAAYYLS